MTQLSQRHEDLPSYKNNYIPEETNFSAPWTREQERRNLTEVYLTKRGKHIKEGSKWSRPRIQPWRAGGGRNWRKRKTRGFDHQLITRKRGKKRFGRKRENTRGPRASGPTSFPKQRLHWPWPAVPEMQKKKAWISRKRQQKTKSHKD